MSDLVDAICNVHNEDLAELAAELDKLVSDHTRVLACATAVRDALNGKTAFTTISIGPCGPCCDTPPPTPDHGGPCIPENRKRPGRSAKFPKIKATEKTLEIARALLKYGAMTKVQIADRLGWKLHQVVMVMGRSKKHFFHREDGKFLVAPALADQLEAE